MKPLIAFAFVPPQSKATGQRCPIAYGEAPRSMDFNHCLTIGYIMKIIAAPSPTRYVRTHPPVYSALMPPSRDTGTRYVSDPTNRNNIHQPRAPSIKTGKMLQTLEAKKPT
eukprot:gene26571-biopygen4060